jgi:hypothetical protein
MTELSHTDHQWIDFEDDLETRRANASGIPKPKLIWG